MAMRMMGEQFVTGETIDEALANSPHAGGARLPLLLRHARRGGDDGRRRRALPAPTTRRRSTPSARPRPAAASTRARASRSSSRRCIRATAARRRERVMGELLPRREGAGAAGEALRHRPQHRRRGGRPAGALARPAGGAVLDPELAGWNGIGFVVQAYGKRCPFVHRLAHRPGAAQRAPDHGAAGEGRLLGRARSSAPRWTGWTASRSTPARSTPTSPTSPARASCWRRRDAVFPQFATHNAQTLAADLSPWPGRDFHRGQYEFQCLHGMGEPLYEEVVGPEQARTAPAASTRRSARTRRCSPTWCAGCWRTAPTPPSSTASPTRACRSRS